MSNAKDTEDLLSLAEQLVIRGNFQHARTIARQIARSQNATAPDMTRAKQILHITGFDPAVSLTMILTFVFLLFLFFMYVL
jgi:hypothetical protein